MVPLRADTPKADLQDYSDDPAMPLLPGSAARQIRRFFAQGIERNRRRFFERSVNRTAALPGGKPPFASLVMDRASIPAALGLFLPEIGDLNIRKLKLIVGKFRLNYIYFLSSTTY